MTTIRLLLASLGLTLALSAGTLPNILFCISDDQSYAHTSANGDPVVQTPAFDRIAREGLRFTHAFCDAPTCGPSRSAILTGQAIWRLLEDRELYNLKTDPLQQTNVFDQHPEIVRKMRGELYRWWDEVGPTANDPQRVVIGSDHENPSSLTACEWLDVFIDQQRQIRNGVQKSGYWLLDVAQDGEYEFELRRWPKEADIPLSKPMPDGKGKALPITSASIYLNNFHHMSVGQKRPYGFEGLTKKVMPGDRSVVFTTTLKKGPIALHTWFRGKDTVFSAYYVYVTRK